MQTQLTLDLSTLSNKQLNAFVEFVNSFLDNSPHFTPTFDELQGKPCPHAASCVHPCDADECFLETIERPNGPSKSETTPKTRKPRKNSTASAVNPAPAAPVAEQDYIDLVTDITRAITAGTLTAERLQGALLFGEVKSVPELSERLDRVAAVREHLAGLV